MNETRPGDEAATPDAPRRPARVFARVMIVQVIALSLLWLLQSTFGQG